MESKDIQVLMAKSYVQNAVKPKVDLTKKCIQAVITTAENEKTEETKDYAETIIKVMTVYKSFGTMISSLLANDELIETVIKAGLMITEAGKEIKEELNKTIKDIEKEM